MKKSGLFVLPLVLLIFTPRIVAGPPSPETDLKLIPTPKEFRVQEGSFHVRPTTRILVEFGHQAEDRIAAETLAEEIHDQSGLNLSIAGARAASKQETQRQRGAIVLARLDDRRVRDFLQSKGLRADSIGDQGYLLFSDNSHLIVAANTGQGLFYGVQTLRQLLREDSGQLVCPGVSIRDWPSMA